MVDDNDLPQQYYHEEQKEQEYGQLQLQQHWFVTSHPMFMYAWCTLYVQIQMYKCQLHMHKI